MQNEIALPYYFEPVMGLEEEDFMDFYMALLRSFDKVLTKMFPNANVELLLGDGHIGEGIVACVEKHNVDAVYLGSRGLGVMKRTFLGSVGDYCAHHLKCPVMIIKHP
jgi:nucleotide-binding universal stress UspA family protein